MKTLTIMTTALLLGAIPAAVAQDQVEMVKLSPEVDESISKGLVFLAHHQRDDGHWGDGNLSGSTALALMAFMVQGHVPGRGEYGRTMDMGITYLVGVAEKQAGYLGGSMYEHGLATLALSEAWGQSKNNKVRDALRAAVDVTLRSQNGAGGWRYSPQPVDADLSVTVMQLVCRPVHVPGR